MAVALIKGSGDVVNGGATVCVGAAVPLVYDNRQRTVHVTGFGSKNFTTPDGRYLGRDWAEDRLPDAAAATDIASNLADSGSAQVALPAHAGRRHVLYGLAWTYDAVPVSGAIQIESPSGTTVFQQDITDKGTGQFRFEKGLPGAADGDMLITLLDGSSAKQLSLMGHHAE